MTGSAVVLGPGGPAGTAWLAGLAAGLRQSGTDLGAAGLIVGTSAGAIVGGAAGRRGRSRSPRSGARSRRRAG